MTPSETAFADRPQDMAVEPPHPNSVSEVAFTDAETAQRWLKSLPLTNVSQLTAALLAQLRAMATLHYPPRERARIAELFREQVAHLHTELARRYAGKPQPPGDGELEAAEQAIGLWQALWTQYSSCLKPLLDGDQELEGVKAKLLQRGLYVGKQVVLVYGLARRSPPAAVWQEIHAYFRLAEMLDCAGAAVSDNLHPNAVGVSCHSTYTHALLLALADPCAMSVKQIELTDRWLQMWARKIYPYVQPRQNEGPILLMDLNAGVGAALVSAIPKHAAESMRFGYPQKLAMSVRGRLKRVQSGAEPSELQLGRDCSIEQCANLLTHLDAKWSQLARSTTSLPVTLVSLSGGGLAGAFFRVSGRTFDRNDPLSRTAYQGGGRALHLQTLGAVTDYDRGRDEAERAWPWEDWQGARDRHDASLQRVSGMLNRWFLDQLVVLRDAGQLSLAYVTRVAQEDDAVLHLSLHVFNGKPQAVCVRAVSSALAEDPPIPCLVLPETSDDQPSLVLPPRTFSPGRVVRTLDGAAERKWRLERLIQRGGDFERIACEPAGS
ncbi:MAG: hypothetical protein M3Z31_07935 [Pseudomonadota bacterium]|nr:hypothetical protein [Pseudomonadota bacterium]